MTSCKIADALLEGAIGYVADLEPKAAENATQPELDVSELVLQLLARHQRVGAEIAALDKLLRR
jgi:hypothetical protein